jgi:hypothetical protein
MNKTHTNAILERLQEPSTYAGLAAFCAGCGLLGLTEPEWNQVFGFIASLAGIAAIVLREKGLKEVKKPTSS